MSGEIQRYRPGAATARALSVPTRLLPVKEVNAPAYGPKLHPSVTGIALWSDPSDKNMRRRLKKAVKRGQVAGAHYLPDQGDGRVWAEIQLLPGRPKNWVKIGILSAIAVTGIGVLSSLVYWVAKLMAAVAAGVASVSGLGVLVLVGALLLAAGGGTITVTTVTTIKRSWF